jgi:radical SAM protein with 4Fe4S-binding SPASM domain
LIRGLRKFAVLNRASAEHDLLVARERWLCCKFDECRFCTARRTEVRERAERRLPKARLIEQYDVDYGIARLHEMRLTGLSRYSRIQRNRPPPPTRAQSGGHASGPPMDQTSCSNQPEFDRVQDACLTRCALPWTFMAIGVTGSVAPCGYWAYSDGGPLGDTNAQSLDEIWNGPGYRELRARHVSGDLEGHPCESCMAFRYCTPGHFPRFQLGDSKQMEDFAIWSRFPSGSGVVIVPPPRK